MAFRLDEGLGEFGRGSGRVIGGKVAGGLRLGLIIALTVFWGVFRLCGWRIVGIWAWACGLKL